MQYAIKLTVAFDFVKFSDMRKKCVRIPLETVEDRLAFCAHTR